MLHKVEVENCLCMNSSSYTPRNIKTNKVEPNYLGYYSKSNVIILGHPHDSTIVSKSSLIRTVYINIIYYQSIQATCPVECMLQWFLAIVVYDETNRSN